VKPLLGVGGGPGDAAVLRPRLGSQQGVAIGCGLVPHLADVDPYWMAAASIDEALRNVVCVGGDPAQTAILDNFCWGRGDDPRQLGALVRACQACYDVALANGVPFISGKDSLNNEFALDEGDVEPLIATLRQRALGSDAAALRLKALLPQLEERIRQRQRLAIPSTLLISAISLISDVARCMTSDLKRAGNAVLLVGGLPQVGYKPAEAAAIHRAVAELIRAGLVAACHDVSDGGWGVALAEMAIAGDLGAQVSAVAGKIGPFAECCAGYLVETSDVLPVRAALAKLGVSTNEIARVVAGGVFTAGGHSVPVAALRRTWQVDGVA